MVSTKKLQLSFMLLYQFSELRKLVQNMASVFGGTLIWTGFLTYETKQIEVSFKNHRCALTCCDANWHFRNGTWR